MVRWAALFFVLTVGAVAQPAYTVAPMTAMPCIGPSDAVGVACVRSGPVSPGGAVVPQIGCILADVGVCLLADTGVKLLVQ